MVPCREKTCDAFLTVPSAMCGLGRLTQAAVAGDVAGDSVDASASISQIQAAHA
jgi:hypothetical protein